MDYTSRINSPNDISKALSSDFWIFNRVNAPILSFWREPIKFTNSCYILLRRGSCTIDLNLYRRKLIAPAFINVMAGSFMHIVDYSEDLQCSCIVLSHDFADNISVFFRDININLNLLQSNAIHLSASLAMEFFQFYNHFEKILQDKNNPHLYKTILFTVVAFFYRIGHKLADIFNNPIIESKSARITDRFLSLLQKNFRSQHLLNFYADALGISPKHLSRCIKSHSGFSATQWIDRYLILEAKVLLRSSKLNVSQISSELNFATSSAFGKFFKKHTGMSPRQYQKSPLPGK